MVSVQEHCQVSAPVEAILESLLYLIDAMRSVVCFEAPKQFFASANHCLQYQPGPAEPSENYHN